MLGIKMEVILLCILPISEDSKEWFEEDNAYVVSMEKLI